MKGSLQGLRIGLVGPVPPPSGGMANQARQLVGLLQAEGADVLLVAVNPPYAPAWIGRVRGLRAGARLIPYLGSLRRAARRVQLFHVLASSGWAWHLFAAPAVWIGRSEGIPVVVNYRGGGAGPFLERSIRWVRPTLRRASALVVPSQFLQKIFARFGFDARIVPNVIDAERFSPVGRSPEPGFPAPRVLIARNLEPVYDLASGLRAFRLVLDAYPEARMTVAGSGPDRAALESLADDLALGSSVRFAGRVENEQMPALYRDADVVLNPSLADNMPISLLEALASGVPVVSTDVGGIPHLVRDGETARLVPPRDPARMAEEVLRLVRDRALAARQVDAGLRLAQEFTWPSVCERLWDVYASALAEGERHGA
jgi:L-malate glycosyltransferase